MEREKSISSWKVILFTLLGLSIFILYLYFFVGFTDIMEVIRRVNLTDYFIYYSLAICAAVLSVAFYSMAWVELLSILAVKLGFRRAFTYCFLANFVDLVIPFETVTGEATRVYLVARRSINQVGRVIASTVCQRIISTLIVLVGLIFGSLSLILRYKIEGYVLNLLILVEACTALFIFSIFYFSIKQDATMKILDLILRAASIILRGRIDMDRLRTKIADALSSLRNGMEILKSNPKGLVKTVMLSLAAWFFHLIIFMLVFYSLGFAVPFDTSLIVYSISVAVQTVPIGLPVGLVEIVMSSLYSVLGVPIAISGTATVFIRIITFWLQILIGYVIAQWIGIKLLIEHSSKS